MLNAAKYIIIATKDKDDVSNRNLPPRRKKFFQTIRRGRETEPQPSNREHQHCNFNYGYDDGIDAALKAGSGNPDQKKAIPSNRRYNRRSERMAPFY
ncbi:MAG: hypothetical protein K2L83_01945 [Muribaculaceae bacterium]|nr:hypothetical protein [Muribaculaceae bacterium]